MSPLVVRLSPLARLWTTDLNDNILVAREATPVFYPFPLCSTGHTVLCEECFDCESQFRTVLDEVETAPISNEILNNTVKNRIFQAINGSMVEVEPKLDKT